MCNLYHAIQLHRKDQKPIENKKEENEIKKEKE